MRQRNPTLFFHDSTFTTEYLYNGDGVRVAQIIDGQRTDYVQDTVLPLPQVLTARNGNATTRYLRGLGLIGEQQAGGSFRYHLPDALGSVRQITDPTGQLLMTQRFDPFGQVMQRTTDNGQPATTYGFAGEEQDPTTGQVYLRARTYNPTTGRFLQQDPVMGQPNQPRTLHNYVYAFNNPVNLVDPSGQQPPYIGGIAGMPFWRPTRYPDALTGANPATQGRLVRDSSPARPRRSYSVAAPTQVGSSFYGGGVGYHARSASVVVRKHRPYSDPYAREQSQGFRPEACGPTRPMGQPDPLDFLFGIRDAGQGVIDEVERFAEDPEGYLQDLAAEAWQNLQRNWNEGMDPSYWQGLWNQARDPQTWQDFKENWGWTLSLTLGVMPVVGFFYDLGSLIAGRDLITGHEFSEAEKLLVFGGLLAGLVGASFIDEVADLNSAMVRNVGRVDEMADAAKAGRAALGHVDEVADAAKTGRLFDEIGDLAQGGRYADEAGDLSAFSRMDDVTATRLRNLDEATAGNQAARRGDELREALESQSSQGALSRRMEQARRTRERLSNLDEATAGSQALKRGDELRESLKAQSSRGALTRRLEGGSDAITNRLRNVGRLDDSRPFVWASASNPRSLTNSTDSGRLISRGVPSDSPRIFNYHIFDPDQVEEVFKVLGETEEGRRIISQLKMLEDRIRDPSKRLLIVFSDIEDFRTLETLGEYAGEAEHLLSLTPAFRELPSELAAPTLAHELTHRILGRWEYASLEGEILAHRAGADVWQALKMKHGSDFPKKLLNNIKDPRAKAQAEYVIELHEEVLAVSKQSDEAFGSWLRSKSRRYENLPRHRRSLFVPEDYTFDEADWFGMVLRFRQRMKYGP